MVVNSQVAYAATRSADLPACGEAVDFLIGALLAVRSEEIVRRFVIERSEQTSSFAEAPAGHFDGAHVTEKVAVYIVSVFVVDDDASSITGDAGFVENERHFDESLVERHAESGVDFNLAPVADDCQGFACHLTASRFVVNNDAEIVVEEIADQQVTALASKFEEFLVESHIVLRSSNHGVTSERRNDLLDIKRVSVGGDDIDEVVVVAAEVDLTQKIFLCRLSFFGKRKVIQLGQLVKAFPLDGQFLGEFNSAELRFPDEDRAPREIECSLYIQQNFAQQ